MGEKNRPNDMIHARDSLSSKDTHRNKVNRMIEDILCKRKPNGSRDTRIYITQIKP